jgi:hypothetical protein
MRAPNQARLPSRLTRVVASFAAGLVMLLSLSAVSPQLHAWLHGHVREHASHMGAQAAKPAMERGVADVSSADEDEAHECAVTMFSHGVVHHAVAFSMQPCEGILRAVNFRAFERLALAQPRYLHRPPQAPPAV